MAMLIMTEMSIFSNSENDYELEYAIDYLLQNYNKK
jgi:hypothetical protein